MADVFSFPEDQFLLVGKVGKPHGLRGEVKVYAFSDEAQTLTQYETVVLVDKEGVLSPELRIENSRVQGKSLILKVDKVSDREMAEKLYGMGVLIHKKDLPETEENEFYWYQFYSLPVQTESGQHLGSVDSIFSNGAQDILVVKDGEKEYLIPILDSIITEHNENGVVIAPPPGLLEINHGNNE